MSFTVKQEHFEGPLELLLDLIEKKKLFVNDVSLSKVADDYVSYVKNLSEFPVADSAHFVLIASTLLLIKSKSLLPNLDLTAEEQASIGDLERRLRLYECMRKLSRVLGSLWGQKPLFARGERRLEPVFSPDESMTTANLFEAAQRVLNNLPKKEFLPKVIVDKVISLEEMIVDLTKRVAASLKMSFKEFAKGAAGRWGAKKEDKVTLIVGFLAMLELVKRGVINVRQDRHFEDIQMETENIRVPKY